MAKATNTGMPLQIAAALAIKDVMTKNHIKGRLMIWPGIAEELLGSKAYYVRAGLFKDVDACIFVHVGNGLGTSWGRSNSTGMVSVEYTFHGKSAHAAADPWDGRSALSAVEIMDVAWSFRREVLHISQRSHRVISNGGDQPNVVPSEAAVWYYFREHDFASVKDLYDTGNTIAEAAAMASGTTVTHKLLGEAAPYYGNRPLAEAAYMNIKAVGMPKWTADDQAFAKMVQTDNHLTIQPLRSDVNPLTPAASGKRVHRRCLRRYRRYHMERAHHHHQLSLQHPRRGDSLHHRRHDRSDAHRPQGRGSRRQGGGDDGAGPDDDAGPDRPGQGLLPEHRAQESEIYFDARAGRSARHPHQMTS